MLRELRERLEQRELRIELTDAARDWLVENGFDDEYGARPLRRLIQRKLENVLAKRVLAGEFNPGDLIQVDVEEDQLAFRREVPADPVPTPVAA